MEGATQAIPSSLIYEMVKGKPIYYRNYREYLNGNKQIEEIMGSSLIPSMIISRLLFLLQSDLGFEYEVLTNKLGIQFGKKSWSAADIAIIKAKDLNKVKAKDKYLSFPPEIVIEIDTKAELSEVEKPLSYFHQKTDELLNFGVSKVVWIFTESKKVMTAEKGEKWETNNWEEDFNILNGVNLNIEQLLEKRG